MARAHFAVFHAARARLYADGLEPRTHSGVLNLWSLRHGEGRPVRALDDEGANEELDAARSLVEQVRRDVSQIPARQDD
jgi:uncharacterized protein (UPF0332 family)